MLRRPGNRGMHTMWEEPPCSDVPATGGWHPLPRCVALPFGGRCPQRPAFPGLFLRYSRRRLTWVFLPTFVPLMDSMNAARSNS